ncbi:MAG: OmpA family protein [Bacteroidales bacterium]|nr:OmpA family protein [Bacteroidales bacterium]
MKKLALIAAALFSLCIAARAQEETEDKSSWFVGAGLGMNFGFDGQRNTDRETSHNGAGIADDLYFGYWFSNWGGFRAGLQGLSISDKFTDFGYKRYEYVHADMLIRAHRNIIPYIHLGWARIDNSALGGGAGIAFPLYISKRVAIVPDIKATTYSSRIYQNSKSFPALTLSATLGISVNLGRPVRKTPIVNVQPVPVTVVVPEVRPTLVRDTVVVDKIAHNNSGSTSKGSGNHDVDHPVITTISAEALFDTNSDIVRADAKDKLLEVVNWMKEHPGKGIIVEGHTDSVGGREFNLNLSLRRAQSVKNFLVHNGARASLISIDGYGYSRPVASNDSPEGRQSNRRVEVRQW